MSQPQPVGEADTRFEASAKRPQPDSEPTSLEPNAKIEPHVKRQKLEDEITTPVRQPLKIVDIDPNGDLLIVFESQRSAYRIDSNALKRVSPVLYQLCLDVRPADGSPWSFNGVNNAYEKSAEFILNIIHANIDQVGESMSHGLVHNIVAFAKTYGMKDRFMCSLKQWFRTMNVYDNSKQRNCSRLWIANELGLDDHFRDLQSWAILNLSPIGNGGIGVPSEATLDKPIDISRSWLADKVVTDRIIQLRIKAVNLVLTRLKEVQLAMTPTGVFGKDGRIHIKFEGHACSKCLDLWFGCLGRCLLQPRMLNFTRWRDFPSISSLIDAKEYLRTLEELCFFIDAVQAKINGSGACSRKANQACIPPKILVRLAVQKLINEGLAPLPGGT